LGLDAEVKVGDSTAVKKKVSAEELNGQILWRDNETRKDASGNILLYFSDPKRVGFRYLADPELALARLAQETFAVLDPDKRAEASKKLFVRLWDETPTLSIGYVNIPWAAGPRVSTWKPYPLALYPSALHTITMK